MFKQQVNKKQKFDRIIKKMRKEKKEKKKEVVENKYVKRNKKIREIFSKRLDKIKEYCTRYKKGQKKGIRGLKPHAASKSFSLGMFFSQIRPNQKLIFPHRT